MRFLFLCARRAVKLQRDFFALHVAFDLKFKKRERGIKYRKYSLAAFHYFVQLLCNSSSALMPLFRERVLAAIERRRERERERNRGSEWRDAMSISVCSE